jgi:hypothetical protein
MATLILFVLSLALFVPLTSTYFPTLRKGSSLSTEKPEDVLTSSNGVFSAGFYAVGENAYCFAIWFNHPSHSHPHTIVWMANRDQPVNGRRSKLSLLKTGNLILTDAGKFNVWASNTLSRSPVQLSLNNTGNLVLHTLEGDSLWESFDFPTDTLLPQQQLTRNTKVVSSKSQSNYSSGFYMLFFNDDNLLSLVYDGIEITSLYWPDPTLVSWDAGRSTYNSSRVAVLDSFGNFTSSDNLTVMSADNWMLLHRRLTVDYDGNIRLYSWDEGTWVISWQAIQRPCTIHGTCGPNSICSYVADSGRKCSCLPGYKRKNHRDWFYGCEREFNLSCNKKDSGFLLLSHVEFYGYGTEELQNYTFNQCKNSCLQLCNCKAFQFKFDEGKGSATCSPKTHLYNGYRSPDFKGDLYLRMPKSNLLSTNSVQEFHLDCSSEGTVLQVLNRTYEKSRPNGTVKIMLWLACGLGGLEVVCIFLVWCLLIRDQQSWGADKQGYLPAATGFRKFTYAELKKATKGFSEEIGRGAGGTVYRGVLSDSRVAAIKRLNEANQGESEFLAEVSIIGRINHMNLIEMWGYCVEGKHRILVYEYMEHGSLAENLSSNSLDWKKRFEIALGTAKGLAYLHEECLEWVLHCDVKPQNILLDSNYHPKVADFGLSKLQNRSGLKNSSFSRIRGTRGYMAPEWIFNLPITSKVDVYSYGIVVLEMVTGKRTQMGVNAMDGCGETEDRRLVTWVREKKNRMAATTASWMEEIIDPIMEGTYEMGKMEILVGMALQCVEEDKDARPSMSQVVEMLHSHDNDHYN